MPYSKRAKLCNDKETTYQKLDLNIDDALRDFMQWLTNQNAFQFLEKFELGVKDSLRGIYCTETILAGSVMVRFPARLV